MFEMMSDQAKVIISTTDPPNSFEMPLIYSAPTLAFMCIDTLQPHWLCDDVLRHIVTNALS